METGTIVILIVNLALFAFAGYVLYKSVSMANKRQREESED